MDKARPCIEALKQGLSDSFTMYFMAHAYHWNVEGPDFHQYHEFFSKIYEEIFESIDVWAENIRKLGGMAPQTLAEIGMPSKIEEEYVTSDPIEMCMALYRANEMVLDSINNALRIAEEIDEQGIADFLAGRDDAHKMWRWQLNSITGMGKSSEEKEEEEMESSDVAYNFAGDMSEDMVFFGSRAEKILHDKTDRYNRKSPASLQASANVVRAVYRRGARSVKPGSDRHEAGVARVDAFLRLLRSGKPANPTYVSDNDLLPTSHQMSDGNTPALVASAELDKEVKYDFEKPEEVVLAAAEMSGLGYESEPIFRAVWMRATRDEDNATERVLALATDKYESKDADLLPSK